MGIDPIDPNLAARLDAYTVPLTNAALDRMAAGIEAKLDARLDSPPPPLSRLFYAATAAGLACAVAAGFWAGETIAAGPTSPVALLIGLATGGGLS